MQYELNKSQEALISSLNIVMSSKNINDINNDVVLIEYNDNIVKAIDIKQHEILKEGQTLKSDSTHSSPSGPSIFNIDTKVIEVSMSPQCYDYNLTNTAEPSPERERMIPQFAGIIRSPQMVGKKRSIDTNINHPGFPQTAYFNSSSNALPSDRTIESEKKQEYPTISVQAGKGTHQNRKSAKSANAIRKQTPNSHMGDKYKSFKVPSSSMRNIKDPEFVKKSFPTKPYPSYAKLQKPLSMNDKVVVKYSSHQNSQHKAESNTAYGHFPSFHSKKGDSLGFHKTEYSHDSNNNLAMGMNVTPGYMRSKTANRPFAKGAEGSANYPNITPFNQQFVYHETPKEDERYLNILGSQLPIIPSASKTAINDNS